MSSAVGRKVPCTCDACGKAFHAYPAKAEREGLSCIYIECPDCGRGYPVAVMDDVSMDLAADYSEAKGLKTEESALLRRELLKALKERSGRLIQEHPLEWFLEAGEGEERT